MARKPLPMKRAPRHIVAHQGTSPPPQRNHFGKPKPFIRGISSAATGSENKSPYTQIKYIPPQTESPLTPSSHDLEPDHAGGLKKLVRDQTLASMAVGVFGAVTDDPASMAVAALNTLRGGGWMTALFNVNSSNQLSAKFHGASHSHYRKLSKALQKNTFIKQHTKGLQKALNMRARKAQSRESKSRNEQSQALVDQKAAAINSYGAGAGSIIHSIQAAFSNDEMVRMGALSAAIGYLGIQIDQAIESRRWEKLKHLFNRDAQYTRSEAHDMVGYTANRQYMLDALLKWMPPITMVSKGGFFCAEAIAVLQHDGPVTGAAAIGLAGVFFIKSGIEEFREQNASKVKYIVNTLREKEAETSPNTTDTTPDFVLDPEVYPAPALAPKTLYLAKTPQAPTHPAFDLLRIA